MLVRQADREGHDFQSCQSGALRESGFSRCGPAVEFESRKRGRVSILGWNRYQPAHNWVLMNIFTMMHEVIPISYAMVGKSTLPDFSVTPNFGTERVGIPAFDELNGTLNRHVFRGSKQQMNMLGHDHESVQGEPAFATIAV